MANANCLSRAPAREKNNNNELLQSLFFDGRRVVGPMNVSFVTLPETYLGKLLGVNQTCIVFCPNWGGGGN